MPVHILAKWTVLVTVMRTLRSILSVVSVSQYIGNKAETKKGHNF